MRKQSFSEAIKLKSNRKYESKIKIWEQSPTKKKKKTLIIVSIISGVILVIGTFFLGRISVKNKPVEEKNYLPSNNQEFQKLKTELNSVKNELNQSNINQKNQLESKLSSIENKIKTLTNQDKPTIQELQREIKEIKEKIRNDKLGDSPPPYTPPTDKNQLQFTVCYYIALGKNHMWIDYDTKSNKIILIDKENPIFPNGELTKKNHNYTITFSAQDAEEYPNTHDQVYYFSKNNDKFTLKPQKPEKSRKEMKVRCSGEALNEKGEFTDYAFVSLPKQEIKVFYISKNHPRIKELLSQGKLKPGKHFIIRYGKVDKEYTKDFAYDFNEDNRELEIIEA